MDHLALLVYEICLSPHSFAVEGFVELFTFGGSLFKILSLTAVFPSQTENIEVTLPLEDRLEGKVGIKTYSDYVTADTQWFSLIFLILVNITAQVNKDIYFGVCPQLGICIFILYLCYHYF